MKIDDLKSQIAAEIGDDELTKEKKQMILQKFGITPPQLTASEKHLIMKEDRKNAG